MAGTAASQVDEVPPAVPLTGDDLDADPKVVAWRGLPGAVDRPDVNRIREQLRTFRPDVEVVNPRPGDRSEQ
ncbi:hypothetical protein JCM33774_76090 [Actinophytocola sp. KF-1]